MNHAAAALADRVPASSKPSSHLAKLAVGSALALAGWALFEVHTHAQRISRLESAVESSTRQLERIETKLDSLLSRGR
jgi:hypothetical protein